MRVRILQQGFDGMLYERDTVVDWPAGKPVPSWAEVVPASVPVVRVGDPNPGDPDPGRGAFVRQAEPEVPDDTPLDQV